MNELVLADGTKIDAKSGAIIKPIEDVGVAVPRESEARRIVVATRRKLADLPAVPDTMNVVAVVLSYHLFGLSNDEIAIAIRLTVDQVERIKESNEFVELHKKVVDQVMLVEAQDVRDLITQASKDAARKIVELTRSENELTAMYASKDVLDRAGHRPADVIIEKRTKLDKTLTVRFVKEEKKESMPIIDLQPVNVSLRGERNGF